MVTSTDKFKNWNNYIDPRVDALTKNDFHLEAFYLLSATIEYILQDAIRYQESWVKHLLHKNKVKFQETPTKSLEEKTIGQLISIFASHCEDQTLIDQLYDFNSSRKKFVHRLMSHSIIELNKEAKKKQVAYDDIVSKLAKYNVKILSKVIKATNRKILKIKVVQQESK